MENYEATAYVYVVLQTQGTAMYISVQVAHLYILFNEARNHEPKIQGNAYVNRMGQEGWRTRTLSQTESGS
jgi:hypothetical protein